MHCVWYARTSEVLESTYGMTEYWSIPFVLENPGHILFLFAPVMLRFGVDLSVVYSGKLAL